MQNVFIRTGHGYEISSRGRCDAFDGYEIVAAPLGGFDDVDRERRHFPRKDGRPGVTYGSHAIKLGRDKHGHLYILMHHGGGREVWLIPDFYDNGALAEHIIGMPERLQYALLYSIYKIASESRRQAQYETAQNWATAYVEKRIKKRRGTNRVEII